MLAIVPLILLTFADRCRLLHIFYRRTRNLQIQLIDIRCMQRRAAPNGIHDNRVCRAQSVAHNLTATPEQSVTHIGSYSLRIMYCRQILYHRHGIADTVTRLTTLATNRVMVRSRLRYLQTTPQHRHTGTDMDIGINYLYLRDHIKLKPVIHAIHVREFQRTKRIIVIPFFRNLLTAPKQRFAFTDRQGYLVTRRCKNTQTQRIGSIIIRSRRRQLHTTPQQRFTIINSSFLHYSVRFDCRHQRQRTQQHCRTQCSTQRLSCTCR